MADGQTSTAGPVTHKTELQVSISDHHESLPLLVTSLHRYSIILGIDWLTRHNPSVNWRNKAVAFNDPFCNKRCRSQCFVRSLSVDDSDSALLPDPEECVEFTFEDCYYPAARESYFCVIFLLIFYDNSNFFFFFF